MPYKYIGRTTDFKGKTLWEILGNLQNFGVGRIIARSRFQRYPEPCYMKVLKVAALPYEEPRKIAALVENTFRGEKLEVFGQIDNTSYKADHVLIPKDEEAEFCRSVEKRRLKVVPRSAEFPPLMKKLIMRQMKSAGETVIEEPRMKLTYNTSSIVNFKIAAENETPDFEAKLGMESSVSPRLYADVKR